MFCTRCGQPLVPGARFCTKCGAAVVTAPAPEQPPVAAPAEAPAPVRPPVAAPVAAPVPAPAPEMIPAAAPVEAVAPAPVPEPPVQLERGAAPTEADVTAAPAKKKWSGEYCAVGIVETGPGNDPFCVPIADDSYHIMPEVQDHSFGMLLPATAVSVEKCPKDKDRYTQAMGGSNPDISVFVTDSRVVIACEKYNKGNGGRWVGGLTAIAANAITRGVEGRLRRGKILVGHVRYEWLAMLAYYRKVSWLTEEKLVLLYVDTQKTKWRVIITFKKQVNAADVANDILRRACYYRTRMLDEIDEKEAAFYDRFLNRGELIPQSEKPDGASSIAMPTYYHAPRGEEKRPLN